MPIGDAEWMARSKELLAKIEEWDAANKAKALNEFAASILSQTGFSGDAPFQPMRWQSSEYKPAEETWAVVELLGHNRHAGRLTEEEKFGGKLGRLDVPQPDGKFMTVYFGRESVFRLTVVGEAEARAVAAQSLHRPVKPWMMPPDNVRAKAIGPAEEIDTYDAQDGDEPDDHDEFMG